jgi:hypothetical protein
MTTPMTPQAQIEYLATKVMGWTVTRNIYGEYKMEPHIKAINQYLGVGWNPLKDWNHWRQVEEKVMVDNPLRTAYVKKFLLGTASKNNGLGCAKIMIGLDLPTRVSALIAAHQELNP